MLKLFFKEYALFVAIISLFGILPFEHTLSTTTIGNFGGMILIFGIIIYLAMSVAHHAEILAHKYGNPYGTLILTMAAVLVEIVIIVIMMNKSHNPTLARDTIYSAIMLDINGLLGLSAIIGGIKYGEQQYNIDSTNSYMSMILVAVGISMIIPNFINEKDIENYYSFMIILFIILYIIFTRVQLKEHKYFFEYKENSDSNNTHSSDNINGFYHATILVVSIILIGTLSEILSLFMENSLKTFGLPLELGAFMVAIISASPELITAVKSASDDDMQTVVNIAVGASLATVLLTIPSVLIVSKFIHFHIELALTPIEGTLLGLTILTGIIHFNDGETNVLEGFVHFVLFILFFYMMFI